jgi:hypothetical protein
MKNIKIETLKKQFDKVYLRYIRPNAQIGTTIGLIVKGNEAFVGISKCHEGDQFNKEIGRNIALGRAIALHNFPNADYNGANCFIIPFKGQAPTNEQIGKLIETLVEQLSLDRVGVAEAEARTSKKFENK